MSPTAEELSMALQFQEMQRKAGVYVQTVEEIISGALPPARKDRFKFSARIGKPRDSNRPEAMIIPFRTETNDLGRVMKKNATISVELFSELQEKLDARGVSLSKAGLYLVVLTDIISHVGYETSLSGITASGIAESRKADKGNLSAVVRDLASLGFIKRVKDGATAHLHVSPRYAYRGRSASFAKVLADYDAITGMDT